VGSSVKTSVSHRQCGTSSRSDRFFQQFSLLYEYHKSKFDDLYIDAEHGDFNSIISWSQLFSLWSPSYDILKALTQLMRLLSGSYHENPNTEWNFFYKWILWYISFRNDDVFVNLIIPWKFWDTCLYYILCISVDSIL